MPNTETVRALVSAFNVNNHFSNTVETNFTLQSEGKKDYIVVSFDKSMDKYQCRRYLDSIKRKIIREFYGIEESNDAEILDTAKLIFDVNSFPFYISDRDWSWDKQHGFKFVTPVDKGVIFNLKSHLASSLEKDIREDMQVSSTTVPFNKEKYLCHSKFDNKGLSKKFESMFLSRMENRYGYRNVFKNPLKVEGNSVYIKDVFDDARFIDSVIRYKTWLEGMYLGVDSSANHKVKLFKDMIVESIGQLTGVTIYGFVCASPLDRKEASVLIPLILDSGRRRVLTKEEALKLNYAFSGAVLNDIDGKAQGELSVNGSSEIYGIDFSNPYISHCVITKIMESSLINERHELAIDPELHFRALSPEPPRTPPEQTGDKFFGSKGNRDSGIGESPPKPKDSGSSSGGPGSLFEQSQVQGFPTRSQDEALNDSPRRGSEQGSETEKEGRLLHNHVNSAGTSKGFPPLPQLNSIAVSYGVSGPSKGGNLGAAAASGSIPGPSLCSQSEPSSWKGANPVGANPWAQQTNPCLSQGTSENKWISSMQFTKPGPSGLSWSQSGASSSKDANKGMSTWTSQPMNHWSSPASSAGLWSLSQSGASSSRGAGKNMLTGSSSWCLPPSTSSLTTRNDSISSNLGIFADPPEDTENIRSMKPEKQQVTDESDRKSSDECSKAKPQKNESPKKHRGGFFCKERPAKLSPFKRCSVERDTISSSRSGPVHYVTEKPLLSKRFASERRATNNPPSGVTSPVTEACIKNKPGATELKDGGFSNRPKIRALVESSSGLNLQPLTSSQKDELYKVLSPEMKEKLDFGFFPPGYKKLLYLLYVDKRELRLLLSSPGKVEQVCSVLPPEERKQLHPNLSLEAKKGLLFKFFGDKQEISRNVSTSSEDSGVFSLSQNSNNSVLSNFSSVNANPMSSMDDAMVECSSSHLQKR